ncbi:uncharacterized protein [Diadema antillarum]|uniref:uncharacterized protein n=1 Tax=Diadema antillarum TaxID=105358 RepID=UPI003A874860
MEPQASAEAESNASTPNAERGPESEPSSRLGDSQPSEQREWSDTSPQRSDGSRGSEESKPQESSPTDSSPTRKQSVCTLSHTQKEHGTPQSQATPQADGTQSKRRCCVRCNPVHICLVLGIVVASGSVAMTACGYMSHEIAMQTVVVGNDTIKMVDEKLRAQVERFRTFGPVLIGLGSFIAMCACVLMCEARDEAKRQARKLLDEDQDYDDIQTRQEHMYALQCEVMNSNTRLKSTSCPHIANKRLDDVAYADESSHSSPVVLVHGPSLVEGRQRNDSQESNESEAAKVTLLKNPSQEESLDVSSIPTCSNYVGPVRSDAETTFSTTTRTLKKGVATVPSPTFKHDPTRIERPTQLSPIKARSVNGPISIKSLPPVEGVCLCGVPPVCTTPPPPRQTNSKAKRVKRGTRHKKKKKDLESKSAGSDSGSVKSVPRSTKSVATQNSDLTTHVNPLHDIPLVNYTSRSPERTGPTNPKPDVGSAATPCTELPSAAASPLAPVETTRESRPPVPRTADRVCSRNPLQSSPTKGLSGDSKKLVWVKQQPDEAPNNNNGGSEGDDESSPPMDARGAICKPEKSISNRATVNEQPRDSNSNVSTMSSKQLSPKATPPNVTYDVIHDKGQHVHTSKSEVVL